VLALSALPATQQVAFAAATSVPCGDVTALQNAITTANAASEPTTITLGASCTYTITTPATSEDGLPEVTNTITIVGNGSTITRDSETPFRILHVSGSGDLTVQNVTITNGRDEDSTESRGGGILNDGATLAVHNSTITSNSVSTTGSLAVSAKGAGIYSTGDTTILNSKVAKNVAEIAVTPGEVGFPAAAAGGGGIAAKGGTLVVGNSTVADNNVSATTADNLEAITAAGGGIVAKGGNPFNPTASLPGPTVTITGTTLSGNNVTAGATGDINPEIIAAGGGYAQNNLALDGGTAPTVTMKMVNTTINGNNVNTAGGTSTGGGIAMKGSFITDSIGVINATVAGNTSGGGAISQSGPGRFTVTNTIVNSTNEANCDGTFTDGGANISFPASDTTCAGTFGTGDPNLGPLALNGGGTKTMALGTGSAAIDTAGDACFPDPPNGAGGIDQRGEVRPGTGTEACDIGAYEVQKEVVVPSPSPSGSPAAGETASPPASGLPQALPDTGSGSPGGEAPVTLVGGLVAMAAVGASRLRRRRRA
jgi:hypothetical protein